MLESFWFQARFLRARLREIGGDFSGAARLLQEGVVPTRYRSLRDAYRLRMLVLANDPEQGPSIIQRAEGFGWFRDPQSSADEYARIYCKYVAAGVSGNSSERKQYAARLALIEVRAIYRNSLKLT